MNLRRSTTDQLDITPRLHASRIAAKRRAAEEFSLSAIGMMAAWLLGFIALISTCVIFWARQPDITPTQLRTLESP